jgi:hypothetical protein
VQSECRPTRIISRVTVSQDAVHEARASLFSALSAPDALGDYLNRQKITPDIFLHKFEA